MLLMRSDQVLTRQQRQEAIARLVSLLTASLDIALWEVLSLSAPHSAVLNCGVFPALGGGGGSWRRFVAADAGWLVSRGLRQLRSISAELSYN